MSHNSCMTHRLRISYLDCLFDVEFCREFRHESSVLTQRKMLSTCSKSSNWKIMIMESALSSGQFFVCVLHASSRLGKPMALYSQTLHLTFSILSP